MTRLKLRALDEKHKREQTDKPPCDILGMRPKHTAELTPMYSEAASNDMYYLLRFSCPTPTIQSLSILHTCRVACV